MATGFALQLEQSISREFWSGVEKQTGIQGRRDERSGASGSLIQQSTKSHRLQPVE